MRRGDVTGGLDAETESPCLNICAQAAMPDKVTDSDQCGN
ncbi:hypothetical protein CAter10_2438 [Collimonas arenae]|nr:hypothetical protein CAter10_2438 [Collimonas arenae]